MSGTNLPGTVGDATLAGIALPEGVTLTAVPWDDAESAELRTIQQAELAVRYADPDADEVPTTSDIGRPPSADEIVVSLLLRVDGVPVGCAALRDVSGVSDEIGGFHAPGTGEVKRVFVAPEYRGRGLSRLLMRGLEAYARAAGLRRLVLETGTKQHESVSLYRSIGFEPIERYGEYADSDESLCFAKDLPAV
ncbi:acetyltransferase (GNAT) family protein [Flavimobilis soli]|uniref:Acetyltransferase (GNAT) family protein n=1 Tax=Flavimobilis soli TaxID=442709 RepID=A0A2A9EFQ2_9MICO|nr:GNAT family N-acetyltransferase [Flavimobilis soli]PFG37115.1 acetyltransferase (GNAT) family protein [Flavimobilis soli]